MAGFGGIGFCCCDSACPCVVSDDFSADTLSLYDVTEGAGFAIASGVLGSTGAGTATRQIQLPSGSRKIGVQATLTNNSHASFGLVLGSGNNRIEWVWDTAGAQATLLVVAGGSNLIDQDYAGAPSSTLKLEIGGAEGAWDITVYRDGTAIATQADVALSFGDAWVAAGATGDASGGTWDDLCIQSCDPLCISGGPCGPGMPIGFLLEAGGFTTVDPLADCAGACEMYGGPWILLPSSVAPICGEEPGGLDCEYVAVASLVDCDKPLARVYLNCFGGLVKISSPDPINTGVWTLNVSGSTDPANVSISASCVAFVEIGNNTFASFAGSSIDLTSPGSHSLSYYFSNTEMDDSCDVPGSITVTPITGEDAEILAGCRPMPCQPAWATDTLSVVVHKGGDFQTICLGRVGASTWVGSIRLDCSGLKLFTVTVERRGLRFWIVFADESAETLDEFPIECDPELPTVGEASGNLTNSCGGDAVLASVYECREEDYVSPCCPEWLCCVRDEMTATGEFSGGLCGCSPTQHSTSYQIDPILCGGSPVVLDGFDASNGYWRAPLPFSEFFGAWDDWTAILYCDGSTWRCAVLDAGNCPQWFGTLVSFNCESFTAVFSFSEPVLSCCQDSIGEATITWAG